MEPGGSWTLAIGEWRLKMEPGRVCRQVSGSRFAITLMRSSSRVQIWGIKVKSRIQIRIKVKIRFRIQIRFR
jgi:hypothetical protein